jgi:hypothetical protein
LLPGDHPSSPRRLTSELVLIVAFLTIISIVPLTQTMLEAARKQRVQATDVFRQRPTSKNLRQFEDLLEEKSVFQQELRPQVQRLMYATLRDTGSKGVLGRDGWLFYRPDLRFLLEPDRVDSFAPTSRWAVKNDGFSRQDNVLKAIVHFRDQLKERGIELLVVPIPGKPSAYPEMLTRRATDSQGIASPTLRLLDRLESNAVHTVNLFPVLAPGPGHPQPASHLYLARDTHWTPLGASIAAQTAAQCLNALGLAPQPSREFASRKVQVDRIGDIIEMMQIPGVRESFPPERVACEQVYDPTLGPLTPAPSDRPGTYRFPGQKSAVLVLGDSFSRIYQYPEPQSLGQVATTAPGESPTSDRTTKRALPGSAGFISHLALALHAPVDAIYSDGGASTDVRRKLSTNPEILEGKKVVIWEFVERDIALGHDGWEDVPLPIRLE